MSQWLVQETQLAHERIRPHVHLTPLHYSSWLSRACDAHVLLKLESEQVTGSFKVRGAINKVLSLTPAQLACGLVTASTGNHALAFSHATSLLQQLQPGSYEPGSSTIFLPTTASAAKMQRLRALGANLRMCGSDSVEAELAALRTATEQGATYISPYNDREIMAGQGTIAIEILQQLGALPQPSSSLEKSQQQQQQPPPPRQQQWPPAAAASPAGAAAAPPDMVFVPVGGGGLISGIAATIKHHYPSCKVIACQPANSDVMRQSVLAGHVVETPSLDTLSDGTAGGVEPGALTLEPCRLLVDEWVTVSEREIACALVSLLHYDGKLVEGAAACAVAALLLRRGACAGRRVVLVCCGANISATKLRELLESTEPLEL